MAKRSLSFAVFFLGLFCTAVASRAAQVEKPESTIRVTVNMVQLNVAVTDVKGNYITRLRPEDFAVFEDGIQQKIATFAFGEENDPPNNLAGLRPREGNPKIEQSSSSSRAESLPEGSASRVSLVTGADVFILFDTSNYMYRGFVFAQDAIAEFVRSLDHPDQVAFYSYSRNFFRASTLTSDRSMVLRGVRSTTVGDQAALYDALLLTLEDAARLSGRKMVVVFSNGPDNSSMVAPEDVRELAQSEGVPIYMISTQEAKLDPISSAVFERIGASTGGKAYFAKSWTEQEKAFASIREDLAHLYSLSYYPQANPNRGWRSITVKLIGARADKYRIRTRSGYRPRAVRPMGQLTLAR